jgi:hypothetical protein
MISGSSLTNGAFMSISTLQQRLHLLQGCHSSGQFVGQEYIQQLADRSRRISQRCTLLAHNLAHRSRREVEQVANEVVGVLHFDAVLQECLGGKITLVVRDDDASLCTDCRRQDVAICRVCTQAS